MSYRNSATLDNTNAITPMITDVIGGAPLNVLAAFVAHLPGLCSLALANSCKKRTTWPGVTRACAAMLRATTIRSSPRLRRSIRGDIWDCRRAMTSSVRTGAVAPAGNGSRGNTRKRMTTLNVITHGEENKELILHQPTIAVIPAYSQKYVLMQLRQLSLL